MIKAEIFYLFPDSDVQLHSIDDLVDSAEAYVLDHTNGDRVGYVVQTDDKDITYFTLHTEINSPKSYATGLLQADEMRYDLEEACSVSSRDSVRDCFAGIALSGTLETKT